MGKTGIPVNINTYEEAERITQEYEENRLYLTSLIENHIPNAERNILSCSDLAQLKYHGRVILNVAKKMLRTSVKKNTEKAILENISCLGKSVDPIEKQLLDERVCIQLEGCNVSDYHSLIKKYERARNN